MKKCRKHNLEQALEEPELLIMWASFLQCEDAAWSSGMLDSKWSNKLVVLCNSRSQPEFLPNPENCLDSNPGLCLSVNRTHPYERGSMCFVSSNNRLPPSACYKSVLPRPSAEHCFPGSRTHSYDKGLGHFAVAYFTREHLCSHP